MHAGVKAKEPVRSFRVAFPWYSAALSHMHGLETARLAERLRRTIARTTARRAGDKRLPQIDHILANGNMFRAAIEAIAGFFSDHVIDAVAAIEATGFIVAAPLALELHCGIIPLRRTGRQTTRSSKSFAVRLGNEVVEVDRELISPGQRILLADDVLASGNTMYACSTLINRAGAIVAGYAFLVELPSRHGRRKLSDCDIFSLITIDE